MTFELKKASSVAVGTFNIYIIQPQWLTKVGILQPETEITVSANMSRPGFMLRSAALKSVWYVSPGKLSIETTDDGEDCGRHLEAVLTKLPVTPIFGLGNNVVFEAERAALTQFRVAQMCQELAVVPNGYVDHGRSFSATVKREGRIFTLSVTMRGDVVELSGNAHADLGSDGTAEAAAPYAHLFVEDKRQLTSLFAEVLGVRVDVASHA